MELVLRNLADAHCLDGHVGDAAQDSLVHGAERTFTERLGIASPKIKIGKLEPDLQ